MMASKYIFFWSVFVVVLHSTAPACAYAPRQSASAWRRSTLFASRKKIPVKSRGLTPAQKAIQKIQKADNDGDSSSDFDKLKSAVYGVGDGLTNLVKAREEERKVFDGYTGATKGTTPAQQLIKNVPRSSSTGVQEPLPSRSVFDTLKGAIYDTADLARKIVSEKEDPVSPMDRLKPATKLPVQARKEVKEALPDLSSANAVKRVAAEIKIRSVDRKEIAASRKKQTEDTINTIKNGAYAVTDFAGKVGSVGQKLPGKIRSFAEAVPTAAQEAVDTVVSIPAQVEEKAAELQTSVENTVNKTKMVVEDVKAVPDRIKETATNTKASFESTAKKVEEVSYSAKVVLGLEKPKPKLPKPPIEPPPKPATPGELALKVTGAVAGGVGKALLWVGKGVAGAGVKALSNGADKVKNEASVKLKKVTRKAPAVPDKSADKVKNEASVKLRKAAPKAPAVPDSTSVRIPPAGTILTETDETMAEVEEALRMAGEAMKTVEEIDATAEPSKATKPASVIPSVPPKIVAKAEPKTTKSAGTAQKTPLVPSKPEETTAKYFEADKTRAAIPPKPLVKDTRSAGVESAVEKTKPVAAKAVKVPPVTAKPTLTKKPIPVAEAPVKPPPAAVPKTAAKEAKTTKSDVTAPIPAKPEETTAKYFAAEWPPAAISPTKPAGVEPAERKTGPVAAAPVTPKPPPVVAPTTAAKETAPPATPKKPVEETAKPATATALKQQQPLASEARAATDADVEDALRRSREALDKKKATEAKGAASSIEAKQPAPKTPTADKKKRLSKLKATAKDLAKKVVKRRKAVEEEEPTSESIDSVTKAEAPSAADTDKSGETDGSKQ